jgi:predicted DsbA family dithiol-disulfide isomerase
MKITFYLDVTSSWCYWAQPMWEELQRRFAGRVEFGWKVALMDASGIPASREQLLWFYRRSGLVTRSPFMLNADWFEHVTEFTAPNFVVEAARDFGTNDDRVRLAIAEGGLRHGRKILRWEESATLAAEAVGISAAELLARAKAPEIETRVRASSAEFRGFSVTQRPTFLLENAIGDRAIFSGLAQAAPLVTTLEAMFADEAAYASHAAHFGEPPGA